MKFSTHQICLLIVAFCSLSFASTNASRLIPDERLYEVRESTTTGSTDYVGDTTRPVNCIIPKPGTIQRENPEPSGPATTPAPDFTKENCGRPHMIMYDMEIGEGIPSAVNMPLSIAGSAWQEALHDGGREFRFFDGGILQNLRDGSPLLIGSKGVPIPASGPVSGGHYLVGSSAELIPGNKLKISIRIETAYSREIVAQASTIVNNPLDALDAVRELSRQFLPLRQTIESFETGRRQRDFSVARHITLDGLQINSLERIVNSGETTQLTISLVDCDGYPLVGRRVKIKARQGIVQPTEVILDASGRATAIYTAPQQSLNWDDLITARFDYTTPEGWLNGRQEAQTLINIRKELWSMDLVVTDSTLSIEDQESEYKKDVTVRELHIKSALIRTKTGPNEITLVQTCDDCATGLAEIRTSVVAFAENYSHRANGLVSGMINPGQDLRFSFSHTANSENIFIKWPSLGNVRFEQTSVTCSDGSCETKQANGERSNELLSLITQFQYMKTGQVNIGKPPTRFVTDGICGYKLEDRQVTDLGNGKKRIVNIQLKLKSVTSNIR